LPHFKNPNYKGYGWSIVSQKPNQLEIVCMYKNSSIFVSTIKTQKVDAEEIEAYLIKEMQNGKR